MDKVSRGYLMWRKIHKLCMKMLFKKINFALFMFSWDTVKINTHKSKSSSHHLNLILASLIFPSKPNKILAEVLKARSIFTQAVIFVFVRIFPPMQRCFEKYLLYEMLLFDCHRFDIYQIVWTEKKP